LSDGDDNDINADEQNEWPPFRRVGNFDPYSDDPRLAVRKITFCLDTSILAVGGAAGQVVLFELDNRAVDGGISRVEMKIIDDKDGFVWKGHGALPVRAASPKAGAGFQLSSLLQIHPPAAVTALSISAHWQVIGVGTAHGFGLYDCYKKSVVVSKTTLKAYNISSAA